MERGEAAKGVTWLRWRKATRKKREEKGREEGEVDKGSEERQIRQARMMVPRRLPIEQLGKVSGEAGFARKSTNVEEEEEDDWQKENQMGMQWDEDEKLEETLERRTMEGKLL